MLASNENYDLQKVTYRHSNNNLLKTKKATSCKKKNNKKGQIIWIYPSAFASNKEGGPSF